MLRVATVLAVMAMALVVTLFVSPDTIAIRQSSSHGIIGISSTNNLQQSYVYTRTKSNRTPNHPYTTSILSNFDWKAHVRFLVIGVQKGGTTSLYKYMRQHVQIQVPAQKETRCFQVEFDQDDPFCERYFANPRFRKQHPDYLTGDFSPGYIWKSETVIPRVKLAYPDARFIVTLRHPIDRAFSQYRMHVRNHQWHKHVPFRYNERTFETVCMDELEVLRQFGLLNHWKFDDTVQDDSLTLQERMDVYLQATVNDTKFASFFGSSAMVESWKRILPRKTMSRGMVQRGLYAIQLHRWMGAFAKEQFLVISLEETSRHTDKVMQRIHAHLGINHIPVNDTTPVNTAPDTISERLSETMYAILMKLYRDYDKMISVVLEEDDWAIPWTYEQNR